MSKLYNERPSRLIGIEDEYIAYCFDEACAYIINKLDEGKKPRFNDKESITANKGLQLLMAGK